MWIGKSINQAEKKSPKGNFVVIKSLNHTCEFNKSVDIACCKSRNYPYRNECPKKDVSIVGTWLRNKKKKEKKNSECKLK